MSKYFKTFNPVHLPYNKKIGVIYRVDDIDEQNMWILSGETPLSEQYLSRNYPDDKDGSLLAGEMCPYYYISKHGKNFTYPELIDFLDKVSDTSPKSFNAIKALIHTGVLNV